MSWSQEYPLRFRQADPAGILFFGQALNLVHDAYEDWLSSLKIEFNDWFFNAEFAVPIGGVQCKYLRPLIPGESAMVSCEMLELSKKTFLLQWQISSGDQICVEISTKHVFMNKESRRAMNIPSDILKKFESIKG